MGIITKGVKTGFHTFRKKKNKKLKKKFSKNSHVENIENKMQWGCVPDQGVPERFFF